MKTTVNFSQFLDAFSDTYKNNFSYEGKRALFDYLENYEQETGEEIELDIVALYCEFTEFENLADFYAAYSDKEKYPDLDKLTEYTTVIRIPFSEAFIIQNF